MFTVVDQLFPLQQDVCFMHIEIITHGQFNVAQMTESVTDMEENLVKKRRKCWIQEFSHFPSNILLWAD